jgi:streptogramin lyase
MPRPSPIATLATVPMESLEARCLLAAGNTFGELQLATGSNPEKVVVGNDGSLYVYEQGTDKLARRRQGKKTFTEVAIPSGNQHFGMAVSRSGDVYFTVNGGLGAYSPKFNRVTTLDLGTDTADVAPGPDGNIWFTEPNANKIGRLLLVKHGKKQSQFDVNTSITTFDVPTAFAGLASITKGPGNDLWFGEDFAGQIGQATLDTTGNPTITEYPLPAGANAHPVGITTGPDGNIWFAEVFADKIGRINASTKAITEFDVPTASGEPFWITTGPDKNLWFTERAAGKVARITTDGTIIESDAPGGANSFLTSIVTGRKKTLYFTESNVDRIGVLTLMRARSA